MVIETFFILALLAFICEYCDSTLGMGYGTIMTPVLILFGYSPIVIIPCVLFSELITGFTAGYFHHSFGNADFRETSNRKLACLLIVCSIIGAIFAVVVSVSIPNLWLKLWIGGIVSVMGIYILIISEKKLGFSWGKMIGFGTLAAFNKGISGGGYGPLVTSGQIISGVKSRNAVAITSIAEGATCIFGLCTYLIFGKFPIFSLAIPLLLGGIISVPFSAWTVSKIELRNLRTVIGIATLTLGGLTIFKTLT